MDLRCLYPGHSLAVQVANELKQARVHGSVRESRLAGDALWDMAAAPRTAVLLGLVTAVVWAVVVALAPTDSPLGSILTTLWQVQAGVLGLAVAISVFGLEVGR